MDCFITFYSCVLFVLVCFINILFKSDHVAQCGLRKIVTDREADSGSYHLKLKRFKGNMSSVCCNFYFLFAGKVPLRLDTREDIEISFYRLPKGNDKI